MTLSPGRLTIPLAHDGRDRPYLLHVPPRVFEEVARAAAEYPR